MKTETFMAQKAFAGKKKPSMLRRCVGHDYTDRQIYMITLTNEGRRPLLGKVVGLSDAPEDTDDRPQIVLSALGKRVAEEWWASSQHHPDIELLALQMMPDHLHGIVFVKEKMDRQLGMVIRGFKQSCNRHYCELMCGKSQNVALATQQTEPTEAARKVVHSGNRTRGLLFARGYNDRLLLHARQLEVWLNYLADNPRRLLMKREHPELFRVRHNLSAAGLTFSAVGNIFLLDRPAKLQVQCSRSLSEEQIKAKTTECLTSARKVSVLVSPAISQGEKRVMRAAFAEGLPMILLQENGLTNYYKPYSSLLDACARGQLLILSPWEHHNEKRTITRAQSMALNEIARKICEQKE